VSRRPRERTRRVGPATIGVRHENGEPRGSTLRWQGYSFALTVWPSRVASVEQRGDALAVHTRGGSTRLLEPRDAL